MNFGIAWGTRLAYLTTKLRAGGMKTSECTLWKEQSCQGVRCPSLSSTAPLSSVSNEAKAGPEQSLPHWWLFPFCHLRHATLSRNLQRFMKSILDLTAFPQFHIRSPA